MWPTPPRDDAPRFERQVLPHLDAAYNLARWLLHDAHAAEDAVQDACERALTYFSGFRGDAARPWFLTIVRRACYDWMTRNRRDVPLDDGDAAEAIDDSVAGPEQAALDGETTRSLAAALAALPPAYREVIVLRELEDLSYKEIAQVVDIPIGTVMSRLARARALLRRSPLLEEVRGAGAGGAR